MLKRIEELYGSIPASQLPPVFQRPEPEQQGERRIRVERPGNNVFIEIAYHAPAATDEDWFKLAILNSVLTGPSGMGGGGIDNKTSRLYRALVTTELVADVDGSVMPTINPYLYDFMMTLLPGRTPEEVEAAFDAEIERVITEPITQAELHKAQKQARALFAYSTERVTDQAFWLAFSENFESYTWFEHFVQRLEAVTIADVQDAAQRYLRPQNRTVGWFIPTGDDGDYIEDEE